MMINYSDFKNKYSNIENGYVLAAMTDDYIVDTLPLKNEKTIEEKLLEIRVFNTEMEAKLFRGDISREFSYRLIDDANNKYENNTKINKELDYSDYFDDYQYLDIDTQKSKDSFNHDHTVRTTGGGSYHLPMEKMEDVMIKVRMYFDKYPETGQARVFDWRVVDFAEKRGE